MTQPAGAVESAPPAGPQGADYVVKGGWYTLWVMLAITLFAFVDRQVLTLAAPPMAASLRLDDGQLGMIQGLAFAIFAVTAVYPIAWAADRYDRRLVLGACIIIWSIGTAACGFARNFEQLFACAVLIAAGEAGLAPVASAFVPELFKGRKRLLANGLVYVFAYFGIAAGLALGGSAIGALDAVHQNLPASLQAFESWRLAFFLVALPAPAFLILLAFTRLRRVRDASPIADAAAASPGDKSSQGFWPFLAEHKRAMVTALGGLGLYMLAFNAYLVWLPVAATRLFGTTPAQNGTSMGIATFAGMIGGVALGTLIVRRLIVRMGPMATIRFFWIAMLVSTPLLAAFPFVGAAWQLFALFGALMLSGTAIGCMVPTLVQDMAPAALRARLFAVWGMVSGVLAFGAPALVGWISAALGTEPRLLLLAMTIVSVPSWIGGIVLFRLAETPFVDLVQSVATRERQAIR